MPTYSRSGTNDHLVKMVAGNSEIYFDSNYGGAPLKWTYPISGVRSETPGQDLPYGPFSFGV